jgi:acetolactate synthase-1/2/3 large subunit
VRTIGDFESAFRAALASGRPTVIDAHIARYPVPHYSPSPHGAIAGIVDMIERRFSHD